MPAAANDFVSYSVPMSLIDEMNAYETAYNTRLAAVQGNEPRTTPIPIQKLGCSTTSTEEDGR